MSLADSMRTKIKKVLKIALPAVGEMILYMLVWVVDTAFVGNYGGNNAVSAVGFSSEIIYTTLNMFVAMGIGVGITTMVAQNIGANNKDKAEEFLSQGLIIGIIIAFILTFVLGVFSEPILRFLGTSEPVLGPASGFMKIVSIGAFFNMLNGMLNSALRGTGNTIIPLVVSIIIIVVVIPLDWVLIFGKLGIPELGVRGSAIATTTGYIVGFIFLAIYFKYFSSFKFRVKYFKRINREYIGKIVKLALPSGLQEGAFSISRLITISFIMFLGTASFAANQITTQIESISYMPGWGFAVAATALVGQRIGAKDYKTAREYAKISMVLGVGVMLICSLMFILVPEFLMKIFIKERETIELGRMCLMVAAIEQPFMALSMVLGGALKGAGDARTPFTLALISSWVIRIPLMYVVIYVLHLSVVYVWVVTGVQWIFEGMAMYYMFKRRSSKWEEELSL
jgi:putative MATE family efflux protein